MKFKLLFLILFTQLFFAQEEPLVYVNDSKSYYNKNYDWLSNESSFCDITISPDSTFSFSCRPNSSCFTWHEIEGKWKKENNIYTFISQYDVTENDVKFTFNNDKSKRYLLKFSTDKKSELKNKSIKIEFEYDFDAELDNIEKTMYIDQNNTIEISFKEIPNHKKLASIRIEYFLNSKEKRCGYITESEVVNVKEKDIPNIVEIEIVEKPIKETIYRTTIGKLDGQTLEIISSTKTTTSLPDYVKEIEFEKFYELSK